MIKSGADVNYLDKKGYAALHFAAYLRNLLFLTKFNLFDILLKYLYISQGHEKNVEALIKNGADVNALDKYHKTPLYTAILAGILNEQLFYNWKIV